MIPVPAPDMIRESPAFAVRHSGRFGATATGMTEAGHVRLFTRPSSITIEQEPEDEIQKAF
jgi:hypothetical protein